MEKLSYAIFIRRRDWEDGNGPKPLKITTNLHKENNVATGFAGLERRRACNIQNILMIQMVVDFDLCV